MPTLLATSYVDTQLDVLPDLERTVLALEPSEWSLLDRAGRRGLAARQAAFLQALQLAASTGRVGLLRYVITRLWSSCLPSPGPAVHAITCAVTAKLLADLLPAETHQTLLEPLRNSLLR